MLLTARGSSGARGLRWSSMGDTSRMERALLGWAVVEEGGWRSSSGELGGEMSA